MKIKKKYLALVVIMISLFLRLYQLGQLPGILNRDEAALAYNAVLLKETGTDEWGKPWPLALESFGDYKLPGYVITLVGLFSFLPQEDWVVRLPAVLAGVSLIPLSYWLAKNWKYDQSSASTVALFVSLTPVFLFYSRMAFEALLGLSLWILFHALVLQPTKTTTHRLLFDVAAVITVVLAVFTYNTPFLLLPVTIMVIPSLRGFKKWKNWTGLVTALILVFCLSGLVFLPLTGQKKGITLFSDETTNTNSISYRQALPPTLQSTVGSKYVYLAGLMSKNLVASLSPTFLVIKGGSHPWHSQPGFSHLTWSIYFLGLVGLSIAVVTTFKGLISLPSLLNKKSKKLTIWSAAQSRQVLLLIIMLFSLAPSVITVDAPHATRSLPFFFWWLFMALEGLLQLSSFLKPKLKSKVGTLVPALVGLTFFFCVLEFGWHSYNYFTGFPTRQPSELRVGFDTAIRDAAEKYPSTPVAVVDGDGYHYIVAAWYLHLSPADYFATIVRQQPNSIGFRYGEKVANFHFIAHSTDRTKTGEPVLLDWVDNQWQLQSF